MARAKLEIEGINRLTRTLREAGADLSDIKEAHRHAAQAVLTVAHPKTPRLYGDLRATLRVSANANAGTVKSGSRRVPYGGVTHWGTPHKKQRAQPWISTAAQESEPMWIKWYEKEMLDAIRTVKGK